MKIGSLELENKVLLAPLAGITNLPFRLLARENGCGIVCSEMISSNGLVYENKKTENLLKTVEEEKPVSIQIFGSDPEIMAGAAKIVEAEGADIVDINMGCSVKKILKSGSGSALMKSPWLAGEIVRKVRDAVAVPVTMKMRTGWDRTGDGALAIATACQDAGADAVAIHPRTATQGFGGTADWAVIKMVKQSLKIPVIGNGDIQTPQDAARMLEQTGCDGVMIGRAAIGKPWLFSMTVSHLNGEPYQDAALETVRDSMKKYLLATAEYINEEIACKMMRSRLPWFVKGMYGNKAFKESIKQLEKADDYLRIIDDYFDSLLSGVEEDS